MSHSGKIARNACEGNPMIGSVHAFRHVVSRRIARDARKTAIVPRTGRWKRYDSRALSVGVSLPSSTQSSPHETSPPSHCALDLESNRHHGRPPPLPHLGTPTSRRY
jgi:hypothetical protein